MKWTLTINKITGARKARNNQTGEVIEEATNPEAYMAARKLWTASIKRKQRDMAYESCGLVKVRGAVSGKTYWE